MCINSLKIILEEGSWLRGGGHVVDLKSGIFVTLGLFFGLFLVAMTNLKHCKTNLYQKVSIFSFVEF